MYDKWSVLRVETLINHPYDFRTLRIKKDGDGRKRYCYVAMTEGFQSLRRYIQVRTASNRRYLDALTAAKAARHTLTDLGRLPRSDFEGVRYPKINPVAPDETQIFRAVLADEHGIRGFRNRELQAKLYPRPANSDVEARSRCSRVSRIIRKLPGHGLVAKVPGSRLYRTTPRGQRVMALSIRFRLLEFPSTMAS